MRGTRHRIPAPRRCVLPEELGSASDTPFLGMSQVPALSPRPEAPLGLLMPCHVPAASSSSKRAFPSMGLNFPVR